jgi:drug/metabolite transporter (DMT)-like permease
VRGIALITLCYFIMTFGDVAVKFALPMAGLTGAILFRGVFGSATLVAMAVWNGPVGLGALRPQRWGLVLMRSLLQVFVGIAWFASWATMNLADSYAVGFATPLIATLLAVIFIGERLDWSRVIATLVGFAGILIMLRPSGGMWNPSLWLLLAGVTCSAVTRIMTRQLSRTETPQCLAFSLLLIHIPVGLVLLPFLPIPGLTREAVAALTFLGLLTGFAQLLNARAYALAPVSALGPFDYSSMLWAIGLGWLCFGEVPNASAMQGALVIAAAGLYSFHLENSRRNRERRMA